MIDLKLDHVTKRYLIKQELGSDAPTNPVLRKLHGLRQKPQEFYAVRDVSFDVPRGQAVGIIGHNGAGKSTLLKLLSNITAPTQGTITITGRMAALIEVGSGFHPELTGRENVYLAGSILGMRRAEIAAKMGRIIDFSDLRRFMETPVKRYSSGMYVRLGFAIAAHLDPDILLLDEVLAVGDATFQAKCLQRIEEMKSSGTTIVFISHDLGAVERLCDRVILMKQGQVQADGTAAEVIAEYERGASSFAPSVSRANTAHARPDSVGTRAQLTGIKFLNEQGLETFAFRTGELLRARMEYKSSERISDALLDLTFHEPDGKAVCQFSTAAHDRSLTLTQGDGQLEFSCPELGLAPGIYYLDAAIRERGSSEEVDYQHRCLTMRVNPGKSIKGEFYLPHDWKVS